MPVPSVGIQPKPLACVVATSPFKKGELRNPALGKVFFDSVVGAPLSTFLLKHVQVPGKVCYVKPSAGIGVCVWQHIRYTDSKSEVNAIVEWHSVDYVIDKTDNEKIGCPVVTNRIAICEGRGRPSEVVAGREEANH